jgi:hypothetical protein
MHGALYKPPRRPVLDLTAIEKGEAELDLGALFKQTSVDEKLLRSHVNELLKFRPQVTLAEVANAFPPQQGLAEIVTYLRIASHEGAAVDETRPWPRRCSPPSACTRHGKRNTFSPEPPP